MSFFLFWETRSFLVPRLSLCLSLPTSVSPVILRQRAVTYFSCVSHGNVFCTCTALSFSSVLFLVLVEMWSPFVTQVSLQLTMYPSLTSNLQQSSYLGLLTTRMSQALYSHEIENGDTHLPSESPQLFLRLRHTFFGSPGNFFPFYFWKQGLTLWSMLT